MRPQLLARLGRLGVTAFVIVLATLLVWQGVSFLARDGQALAPITGQYYVGDSWMTTPTALAAPTPVGYAIAHGDPGSDPNGASLSNASTHGRTYAGRSRFRDVADT